MKRTRKFSAIAVGTVIVAGVVGIGAGTAVAVVPALPAPTGVKAADGTQTVPMAKPSYKENAKGLSYGSAAQAPDEASVPDLIAVTATNGADGYVKKAELEDADGTTAAKSFKTPDDAIKWQEEQAKSGDKKVTVYAVDGTTVVGEFVIAAPPAS